MKKPGNLFISFLCWAAALLMAFAQLVVSVVPGVAVGKPFAFIASLFIIASVVAARIFEPLEKRKRA